MLTGGLVKFIHLPEVERAEWLEAINFVMQNERSKQGELHRDQYVDM